MKKNSRFDLPAIEARVTELLALPYSEAASKEVNKLNKFYNRFLFCLDTPSVTYIYVKGNANRFEAITLRSDGSFFITSNAKFNVHDMFWPISAEQIIERFLN